jgi:hypothetical protein
MRRKNAGHAFSLKGGSIRSVPHRIGMPRVARHSKISRPIAKMGHERRPRARRPRPDFRYAPLATKLARHCNMSRWANSRLMHRSNASLFHHLVGAGEDRFRHGAPSVFAVLRLITSSGPLSLPPA